MNRFFYPLIFIFLCLLNGVGYSQPDDAVYAKIAPGIGGFHTTGNHSVVLPGNAVSSDGATKPNNTGAGLTVSGLLSVAWIQLPFVAQGSEAIPGNKTIYVKCSAGASSLLGLGALGGRITAEAFLSQTSDVNPIALAFPIRTFYAGDGGIYIAIRPTSAFRSVRITLSALLSTTSSFNVFYAFYGPNSTNQTDPFPPNVADCGLPNLTDTDVDGVLSLSSFVLPGNAIDNSLTTGSTFSITAGLLATLKQTFYFNGVSNVGDAVRVIFSKGSAANLASVDIGSNLTIQAFNEGESVGASVPFTDLLTLNLLSSTLLKSSTSAITAYVTPKDGTKVFDRVVVSLNVTASLLGGLVNGASANGFNIFDVRRVPTAPEAPTTVTACTNIGLATLVASLTQPVIQGIAALKWYNVATGGTGTSGANLNLTGLTTPGQSSYYVDVQKSGCEATSTGSPSARTKVTVNTVNPPTVPPIALIP